MCKNVNLKKLIYWWNNYENWDVVFSILIFQYTNKVNSYFQKYQIWWFSIRKYIFVFPFFIIPPLHFKLLRDLFLARNIRISFFIKIIPDFDRYLFFGIIVERLQKISSSLVVQRLLITCWVLCVLIDRSLIGSVVSTHAYSLYLI